MAFSGEMRKLLSGTARGDPPWPHDALERNKGGFHVTLSRFLTTTAWLVRDTFHQSLASGLCWLLLGLSHDLHPRISASVSGRRSIILPGQHNGNFPAAFRSRCHDAAKLKQWGTIVPDGTLSLAFGKFGNPLARDAHEAVQLVQLVLSAGVADTLRLLLLAGVERRFPCRASSTGGRSRCCWPSRGLGGSLIDWGSWPSYVAQAGYFVVGTWLALALQTGIWDATYFADVRCCCCIFAIFFSFSLLLAVCSRSTVVSVFGSIGFWGVCWAINYGRHCVMAAELAPKVVFAGLEGLANIAYWPCPKPVDLAVSCSTR